MTGHSSQHRRTFIAFALFASIILPSTTKAAFNPGDVLLTQYGTSQIEQFGLNEPGKTFTGTGTNWAGNSLTPAGNLVTAYTNPSPGIDIFSPDGTQITTFSTPMLTSSPSDVSVFPDGLLAITQAHSANAVVEYTQTGTYVRTISITGAQDVVGNAVAPDGTLWAADWEAGKIYELSETGTLLRTITTGNPTDVAFAPDGSFWESPTDGGGVNHFSSTGTNLGGFSTPGNENSMGIAVAPDGKSVYVIQGQFISNTCHYSTTGVLLGELPGTGPISDGLLTVVVPEPTSMSIILIATVGLAGRRRN
jgi:sugar lactone lactonase YvrE